MSRRHVERRSALVLFELEGFSGEEIAAARRLGARVVDEGAREGHTGSVAAAARRALWAWIIKARRARIWRIFCLKD